MGGVEINPHLRGIVYQKKEASRRNPAGVKEDYVTTTPSNATDGTHRKEMRKKDK